MINGYVLFFLDKNIKFVKDSISSNFRKKCFFFKNSNYRVFNFPSTIIETSFQKLLGSALRILDAFIRDWCLKLDFFPFSNMLYFLALVRNSNALTLIP